MARRELQRLSASMFRMRAAAPRWTSLAAPLQRSRLASLGGPAVLQRFAACPAGFEGLRRCSSAGIQRLGTEDPRMSKLVVHGGVVYMSGQVGHDAGETIESQTSRTLQKIDELLQIAGTTRSSLLSANIWLKDIERDFKSMNAVWNAWVDPANKPVRATVQASMASPAILIEVQVTAAALEASPRSAAHIRHLKEVAGVPPPGAFSRAVVHGGFVYVSGTGADNDTGGAVAEASAFDETRQALANVERILRAAGSAPDRIVSATMLLSDRQDYSECNRAYIDFFAAACVADLPARSTALWGVPTSAKVAFSVVASL
mmetsp:Transcript_86948/g.249412  ORF Transcript_86948/g.249412 Transcript_86948/m.249412 type:complete len:317 (-) Transcript_86948:12-962(-)